MRAPKDIANGSNSQAKVDHWLRTPMEERLRQVKTHGKEHRDDWLV